jgi:hypothetical protein
MSNEKKEKSLTSSLRARHNSVIIKVECCGAYRIAKETGVSNE